MLAEETLWAKRMKPSTKTVIWNGSESHPASAGGFHHVLEMFTTQHSQRLSLLLVFAQLTLAFCITGQHLFNHVFRCIEPRCS